MQGAAVGGERPTARAGLDPTVVEARLSYVVHQDDISNVQFGWPAEEIRPREYPELEAPRNFDMPLLDGAPLYPVKTDEQEVARSLLCSAPGGTKHLQPPEHLQVA